MVGANSQPDFGATEVATTVTITTVGAHGFTTGETVAISGVGAVGYNGTFIILATPTATTFTYTAPAGLAASSGGTANVGIVILEPLKITKSFVPAIPVNGTSTLTFSINNPERDGSGWKLYRYAAGKPCGSHSACCSQIPAAALLLLWPAIPAFSNGSIAVGTAP